MLPPRYDFDDILKGNDWSRQISFQGENGPLDLTGSELVFFVGVFGNVFRKSTNDLGSGFSIVNPSNGLVQITFTHDETRDLPSSRIRYEIERRLNNIHTTLVLGELVVTEWVNDDD